jgi:hypothetical protein
MYAPMERKSAHKSPVIVQNAQHTAEYAVKTAIYFDRIVGMLLHIHGLSTFFSIKN